MTMYSVSVKTSICSNLGCETDVYGSDVASQTECESGCGCVLGQAGKPNDCVVVQGDMLMYM